MDYELVFCIINKGFAYNVMTVVREAGARGGTIINARGTAREEAEKMFGIAISSEKEIVLVIIEKELKDNVLKTIYDNCGLSTPGQGIVFTLPVDDVLGLNPIDLPKE